MKLLVSIIIPVYNVEKYLSSCITSIISQTYTNLQIILVDDGTPDNSGEICDEFAKKDNRITVIHKKNGGLSSARNAGLDIATGDYIMFVDGDDFLVDNAVEILVSANEEYDADFVQFDTVHVTRSNYSFQRASYEYNAELLTDLRQMYWKMYKTLGPGVSACTKLHKRALFDDLRFKEGIIHEDDYLTLFMLQRVKSALYLDSKLYYYIVHENSILTSSFSKKKLDVLFISECRLKELKRLKYDDLADFEEEQYFLKLVNLWCSAKCAKDKDSLKTINHKLIEFKNNKTAKFRGKSNFLFKLCRINVNLLYFYSLYKKARKQA